jgi:zinc protease
LEVLNAILSGQGGRLFLQLRDRQSLAYAITSFFQEGVEPGFFGVYIGTDPRKVEEASHGLRLELEKVLSKKVSADELQRAKRNIVGSFEIELQRLSAQASNYAYNELYGLGWEHYKEYSQKILKVTADEVLQVAKKYLNPRQETSVVVGPEAPKMETGRTSMPSHASASDM